MDCNRGGQRGRSCRPLPASIVARKLPSGQIPGPCPEEADVMAKEASVGPRSASIARGELPSRRIPGQRTEVSRPRGEVASISPVSASAVRRKLPPRQVPGHRGDGSFRATMSASMALETGTSFERSPRRGDGGFRRAAEGDVGRSGASPGRCLLPSFRRELPSSRIPGRRPREAGVLAKEASAERGSEAKKGACRSTPPRTSYSMGSEGGVGDGGGVLASGSGFALRLRPRNGCRPNSASFSARMP